MVLWVCDAMVLSLSCLWRRRRKLAAIWFRIVVLTSAMSLLGLVLIRHVIQEEEPLLPTDNYKANTLKDTPTTDVPLTPCWCHRSLPVSVFSNKFSSSCSDIATQRGPGQNVVSYSFYGPKNSTYYNFIDLAAKEVRQKYPGWVMRLYHNTDPYFICSLLCRHENLDTCFVGALPGIGDIRNTFGMLWRFLVLGDRLVNRFLSRDLDSEILDRETAAVDQWIESNRTWHVMRDHPFHFTEILGGMWGVYNAPIVDSLLEIRKRILALDSRLQEKGYDQEVLAQVVWPEAKKDLMAHDSFLCETFPEGFTPFPTKRENGTFVGSVRSMRMFQECPVACRPRDHMEWINC